VAVPYPNQVDPAVYSKFDRPHHIDDLSSRSRRLNPPSAPANDATFIRRAYLDAAGILPTAERSRTSSPTSRPPGAPP
jgi:hypothetical protein